MNQVTLINATNIPESLVEAVISQMGGWDEFQESAINIVNHGINEGFHGFIYYHETVRFAANNLSAILSYAKDMAEQFGEDGAYSFIACFDSLPEYSADDIAEAIHTHSVDDDSWDDDFTRIMNALAWFAAEQVSLDYDYLMEAA